MKIHEADIIVMVKLPADPTAVCHSTSVVSNEQFKRCFEPAKHPCACLDRFNATGLIAAAAPQTKLVSIAILLEMRAVASVDSE